MSTKVLVVEDEVLVRFDTSDQLRGENLVVLEASNVAQAIHLLEKNPDVAVLFTDVRLPGKLNGLDLARHVRTKYPKCKVLITSGHMPTDELPSEFGPLIDKPYRIERVLQRIRAALS